MKQKITFLAVFISLIIIPFNSKATSIDSIMAKGIATNFYTSLSTAQNRSASPRIVFEEKASTERYASITCYYVVNMGNEGFVIVSGDDCARPVLAYSTEGAFNPQQVPVGMQDMLNGYREEIRRAVSDGLAANEEVSRQWTALVAPTRDLRTVVVEPLIQTTWNQYPIYNSMCPTYNFPGYGMVQAVTGCAATATAQILRYWEWPVQGVGSHTYHAYSMDNTPVDLGYLTANFGNTIYLYDLMPTSVSSSTHALMREQVARLSSHCGISIDMQYSVNGSGAYSEDIPDALRTYFDYSCDGTEYMSQYSVSEWRNMLRAELDLGHPLAYSGSSSTNGGHAFICDGYDDNNYFHFNFGWGGSGDGFFTVSGTGVQEYSNYQDAIFGIEPNRPVCDGETCSITIDLSNSANSTGWNGGYLVVYQGDIAIKGVVLKPSLASDSYTFNVCEDSLHFNWFSGSNDAACSFVIRNADNDTLYACNGNPTAGRFLSVNYACSDCPYPINLEVSNIDEREATISWTCGGAPQGFNLEYGPTGFATGTGTMITNAQSPYTLTNLQPEHGYDVHVQAICNDSTSSGWSSRSAFNTNVRCNNDNNQTLSSTVGNSGTRYIPIDFSGNYRYSYCQQIFSRSELNTMGLNAGKINSLSFQTYQLSNQTVNNISIYIGHTEMDTFQFSYLPISEMTLVYSGSISLRSGNMVWNEIVFQEPFIYDGNSSLVVAVLNNSGAAISTSGSQGCFLCHNATYRKGLITESTSQLNVSTISEPDYYLRGTRNNMKFNACLVGYGCDDVYADLDSTVCENDFPFTWNGITFDDEGSASTVVTYNGGCDSIVTMTVHKAYNAVGEDTTALSCGEFTWHGQTYAASGDYTRAIATEAGCDSVVTLHLTILPAYDTHDYVTICETELPYMYAAEDTSFEIGTVSGTYVFAGETELGCDSIRTLHLTIGMNHNDTIIVSNCGPYTWNGQTYAQSGFYTDSLSSQYGCDSIVTLNLTINPVPTVAISGNLNIQQGESTTLTASGADTYLWSNGSSQGSITVNPSSSTTYSVTGTTEAGCTATASATVDVTIGINDEIANANITIYPNPATDRIIIELNKNFILQNTEIQLFDIYGKEISSQKAIEQQVVFDLSNYANGMYMLRVVENGEIVSSTKIMKQ